VPVNEVLPARAEVVIAGGGFAGAATACFLARRGVRDVLLLEAGDQFGEHSSGLNASMNRQVVPDPVTGALLRASTRAMLDPSWPDPVDVRRNGSLLLAGDGPAGEALLAGARAAALDGLDVTVLGPDDATTRVPVLEGTRFRAAILTGSDGVVDVHALLWRFLRGARRGGATLATGCPVQVVEVDRGRVRAVVTPRGRVECAFLVDAAGAWANPLAALAGLSPLPMTRKNRSPRRSISAAFMPGPLSSTVNSILLTALRIEIEGLGALQRLTRLARELVRVDRHGESLSWY